MSSCRPSSVLQCIRAHVWLSFEKLRYGLAVAATFALVGVGCEQQRGLPGAPSCSLCERALSKLWLLPVDGQSSYLLHS